MRYFIILLILFFISFYMGLLIFVNFSLWFILLQDILVLMVLFMLIVYFKSLREAIKRFSIFLFYYLVLEIIIEIIVFFNYLVNIEYLFLFLVLFKISCFPFMFYKEMFNRVLFKFKIFRVLLIVYLTFSKFIVLILLFLISIPFEIFIFYCFLNLIYFIYNFSSFNPNYIINSFMLSNFIFFIIGYILNPIFVCFYIIINLIFQYKVFGLFTKQFNMFSDCYFFLMLVNGSPIFIFNWFKFYLQAIFISISLVLSFLQVLVSSLFLTYSMYMFLSVKGKHFKIFFKKYLFILILLFLLFNALLIYGGLYLGDLSLLDWMFFNSYQFINLFPGILSIDFFLIYGENISVSIFLLFFISYIFFKGLSFNIFLGFLGINKVLGILEDSFKLRYFNLFFIVNYFDIFIFIIPYILIIVSTSNFIFLVEGINFLNIRDITVLVFILAYQWGWDVNICLLRSLFYCDVFYFGSNFYDIFYNCFNFDTHLLLSFLVLSFNDLYFFYQNILDCSCMWMFKLCILDEDLFLPKRVNIFIQGVSLDVIHALYIYGLSIKEDLVGDRVLSVFISLLDFDCDYLEFSCFEYCGDFHYSMNKYFYIVNFSYFSLLSK